MNEDYVIQAITELRQAIMYDLDACSRRCGGVFCDMRRACISALTVAINEVNAQRTDFYGYEHMQRALLISRIVDWNLNVEKRTLEKLRDRGAL